MATDPITAPSQSDDELRRELRQRAEAALASLRQWIETGDEQEQRETLDYLKQALDEDWPSQRKHFP